MVSSVSLLHYDYEVLLVGYLDFQKGDGLVNIPTQTQKV